MRVTDLNAFREMWEQEGGLPTHMWWEQTDTKAGTKPIEEEGNKQNITEAGQAFHHDVALFKESEAIWSGDELLGLLDRLDNAAWFRDSEMTKIYDLLQFFEQESKKFVAMNLTYLCHLYCEKLKELFSRMEIDSCERMYLSDEFGESQDETEDGLDWEYVLLPSIVLPLYKHMRATDPVSLSEKKSEYQIELEHMTSNCRHSYNNYRAAIRNTLFI